MSDSTADNLPIASPTGETGNDGAEACVEINIPGHGQFWIYEEWLRDRGSMVMTYPGNWGFGGEDPFAHLGVDGVIRRYRTEIARLDPARSPVPGVGDD